MKKAKELEMELNTIQNELLLIEKIIAEKLKKNEGMKEVLSRKLKLEKAYTKAYKELCYAQSRERIKNFSKRFEESKNSLKDLEELCAELKKIIVSIDHEIDLATEKELEARYLYFDFISETRFELKKIYKNAYERYVCLKRKSLSCCNSKAMNGGGIYTDVHTVIRKSNMQHILLHGITL